MSSLVVTLPVNNTCNNSFKARLNRRVMTTSPNSRHEGFWLVEFLLLNSY
jgi:hypothetical protein